MKMCMHVCVEGGCTCGWNDDDGIVGKNKSGAARWITSFTMMLLILVFVYLQRPMKEFPMAWYYNFFSLYCICPIRAAPCYYLVACSGRPGSAVCPATKAWTNFI